MKKTAKAFATIAFIKYWGKKNEALRLPQNSSISMSLDRCFSITTVDFDNRYKKDYFSLENEMVSSKEIDRVIKHLDRIRNIAKVKLCAKVVSKNSFPKSTGAASSASGFAALTVAAAAALNLKLAEKDLSILARLASGSACRSIPEGFQIWQAGNNNNSYAYSLHPANYWDLLDILVIFTKEIKPVGSTEGHALSRKSPFYLSRIKQATDLIPQTVKALVNKDFATLGQISEQDCLAMHAVMMTSQPPIIYWTGYTVDLIRKVYFWRQSGIPVYFTIDAGPNVHLLCQSTDKEKVLNNLKSVKSIVDIIINKPAPEAHLINNHLF